MPLISVPAIYDGKEIKLLEPAPVNDRYRVLVTFVAPEPATGGDSKPHKTLVDLEGTWRNVDVSFEESQAAEYVLPEDLA